MNTTLWQIVASGGPASLISNITAVANRDTRARLLEQGAFEGQFQVQLAGSLGYVPNRTIIQDLMRQMEDVEIAPVFNPEIPIPVVTIGQGNIPEVEPVVGYQPYLYSWNFLTFEEEGLLDTNSPLPAGTYVVAHKNIRGQEGLPTAFITISQLDK